MNQIPEILPVKPRDDLLDVNENLHPHLPAQPSVITIIGNFGCGKSTLLVNLCSNDDFFRNRVDKILLFSPTAENDDTYRFLQEDPDVEIVSNYSDDYLQAFLDFQLECPKEERNNTMVIFDDALQYIKAKGEGSGAAHLATKFRHYLGGSQSGGYLCYVSQYYKALPPMIRCNTGYLIIMKCPNIKTLRDMAEELDGFLGGNFARLYSHCIYDQKYSFLSINLRENPPIAYKRFSTPIYAGKWLIPEPPMVDINNLLSEPDELNTTHNTELPVSEKKKRKNKKKL